MTRLLAATLVLLLSACSKTSEPVAAAPPAQPAALAQLDPAVASALAEAHARWTRSFNDGQPLQRQVEQAAAVGRLALAHEQFGWAAEALAWARDGAPRDFRWHYLLAVAEQGRAQHDAAVASLRAALQLEPSHVPARLRLGELLLERGATAEAAAALGRRQPGEGAALLGLRGRIALARDEPMAAVELLTAALDLEPQASRLHYPLGLALRAVGRESDARAALAARGPMAPTIDDPLMREVAAQAGGSDMLLSRAGELAQAGEFLQAAEIYRQALAMRDSSLARLNLATVLARGGRPDEAEEAYGELLEVEPDNGAAHFGLGVLLAARGEDREASAHYRRAIELHPNDLDARFNLANAMRRLGDLQASLSGFADVAQRDPARVDAKLAQAQVLMDLRHWDEAAERLRTALEAHPADARLALLLARLLAAAPHDEVRDGAAALRLAEHLFGRERTLPHAEALAMALAELGRFEEARSLQAELVASARREGRRDLLPALEWALNNYSAGRPLRL